MKIRTDFVTNSSSSSFLCEVCGDHWEKEDYEDFDYLSGVTCVNKHNVCVSHIKLDLDDPDQRKELLREIIQIMINKSNNDNDNEKLKLSIKVGQINEMSDEDVKEMLQQYDYNDNIPEKYCPLCNLSNINNEIILDYLLKKYDLNRNEIEKEIKSTFNNLKELNDFKGGI